MLAPFGRLPAVSSIPSLSTSPVFVSRLICHMPQLSLSIPPPTLSLPMQKLAWNLTSSMTCSKIPCPVPSRDMVIILGDFNAHVGSNFVSHSSVVGPHGLGECSENRTRLLDFCVSNQLLLTNTWFQNKPLHQMTWYRNGDCSRPGHMMDFILVNSRFLLSVLDTGVFHSIYHVSNHEMVVSTMRFRIKAKCRQSRNPLR